MSEANLSGEVAKATMWSGLTQVAAKIIPPITNMILARLLTPEAFGIVATFNVIISFADIFTDAGFQKYIVQHEFDDEDALYESINVAFWTNFIFSVIIWGMICCFATPLTITVGSPGCEKGIIIACLIIPITSFSSVQQALLRREFKFKLIFWVRLILSAVPLIITVPLAVVFRNYWALLIGTVARELMNSILLSVLSPWKPKIKYSFQAFKDMFSFSAWTLLEQIAIWLTANIGIFIVGRYLSQYHLGIYKTSMSTVNSILTIISTAITPVLFSALSRVQSDVNEFRRMFYKFQRLLAVIILPLGVGIFVYRQLVTDILLGSQWNDAVEFVGIWAAMQSLSILINSLNAEAIRSKGQPKISLLIQCVQIIVTIILLGNAAKVGFRALYIARSFMPIVSITLSSIAVYKLMRISIFEAIIGILPAMISSIVMGCCGRAMLMLNSNIVWQLCSIVLCIVVYFGCLFVCFPKTRREVLDNRKLLMRKGK